MSFETLPRHEVIKILFKKKKKWPTDHERVVKSTSSTCSLEFTQRPCSTVRQCTYTAHLLWYRSILCGGYTSRVHAAWHRDGWNRADVGPDLWWKTVWRNYAGVKYSHRFPHLHTWQLHPWLPDWLELGWLGSRPSNKVGIAPKTENAIEITFTKCFTLHC